MAKIEIIGSGLVGRTWAIAFARSNNQSVSKKMCLSNSRSSVIFLQNIQSWRYRRLMALVERKNKAQRDIDI